MPTYRSSLGHQVARVAGQDGFEDDPLVAELDTVRRQVRAARHARADAERFAQARRDAWERLSGIIQET